MMGHLIRFIHNRDVACANIATAYVRTRFILASPPEAVAKVAELIRVRLRVGDRRSIILPMPKPKSGRGYFDNKIETSRRNSRIQDVSGSLRLGEFENLFDGELTRPDECLLSIKGRVHVVTKCQHIVNTFPYLH